MHKNLCRPDPVGHMVTDARHLLRAVKAAPAKASLLDRIPGVFDQGQTGSCTGWATCGAIATRMNAQGAPIGMPSAPLLYKLSRAIDRTPNTDGSLPALQDEGAMPNQVMRAVQEWGLRSLDASPFEPESINDEPSFLELEGASDCRLAGMYRIGASGSSRIAQIRSSIVAGYPVCFAIDVDDAFEEYDGSALLSRFGGPNYGGHYLYCVGYDTTSTGETIITGVNSWGTSWGQSGLFEGDEAFVAGWSDIYVLNVKGAEQ